MIRAHWLAAWVLLSALPAAVQNQDPDHGDPGGAAPTRKIEYKTAGDKKLSLHLFEPKGLKPADKRAAIVFFHGGGWNHGDPSSFYWQGDYFAKRGMVAFSAEYRLTPQGVQVADCIADAKSAVRWVRAHAAELGVDPARIAAGGGSAGGHLAAAAAIVKDAEDRTASSRPDLLVLFNPALFHPRAKKTLSLEMFTAETPAAQVFYGTKDAMVTYGHDLLAQSRKLGNVVDFHTAEAAGHGFFHGPPWREQTTYLADQFLAKHGFLQGAPTLEPKGGIKLKQEN